MAKYYTYNSGVEAKHLHLGNLVHDYKNPNDLEPYIEKAYTDVSEPPPSWALSGSLENYALTLGKASKQEHDAELDPGNERETSEVQGYRVVAAARTTRVEIKDSDEFFESHTLKSPAAKKWLASHLSAFESLSQSQKFKNKSRQPQIWMLTGLILMQHATWTRLSSRDKKFVAGERAPFIPAGVSAIRKSSVSDAVKPTFGYDEKGVEGREIPGGHVIHETGKYPGTRCWAAQWQRVDVRVVEGDKNGENKIELKGGEKVAFVELGDDEYAVNEEDENEETEEVDDGFWDAFIDELDD